MKNRPGFVKAAVALILLSTINIQLSIAFAQGTAFTYQGRLNDGGSPANGSYDFRFRIASDALGNNLVAGPLLTNAVPVTGGLFTVRLDFGAGLFAGSNYWLQVDVKTNAAGSYATLAPLQAMTPTPYAIFANTASNLSGTLPAGQLSGMVPSASLAGTYGSTVTFNNAANSFSGNGSGLTGVNAATLNGLGAGNLWQTSGNAGTVAGADFVGTTDNQPLEFKVNDTRALRLEPNMYGAPNVIGGSPDNFVANGVNGATLAGGGAADYGPVSFTNSISADFAVLGGGRINAIQSGATDSTIGGGYFNVIQSGSTISTIAGGSGNTIGSFGSAIGGGAGNIAQTNISYCTIAGGFQNVVNGDYGTVPGGSDNTASTNCFAAGHRARANGNGNFVWADSTEADFSSSGKNQFLIRAGGGVGIGTTAPATALHVRGTGDTEISVESVQGGERWTLQSSGTNTPGKNGSFQIIDRTANASRLLIDTNGNVGIGTNPTNKLDVAGNISCSSNVYAHGVLLTSDRYAKTNFVILEQNAILKKVADLPLTQWNYLGDDEATKHIGPMAQDFHAAFGLNGGDDKHISVVDESGVALAAIQGLNQKLNEKDSEIQSLKLQNENLEKRLDSLEQAVRLFTAKN